MRENLPASLAEVEVSLPEPLLVSNAILYKLYYSSYTNFSGSGYYCNRLPLICGLLQKVYSERGSQWVLSSLYLLHCAIYYPSVYVCASSLYSREGCVSSNCLPFDMCVGVALKHKYSSYGRAFCVYIYI